MTIIPAFGPRTESTGRMLFIMEGGGRTYKQIIPVAATRAGKNQGACHCARRDNRSQELQLREILDTSFISSHT
jgi:hypothetical protein